MRQQTTVTLNKKNGLESCGFMATKCGWQQWYVRQTVGRLFIFSLHLVVNRWRYTGLRCPPPVSPAFIKHKGSVKSYGMERVYLGFFVFVCFCVPS